MRKICHLHDVGLEPPGPLGHYGLLFETAGNLQTPCEMGDAI